MIRNRAVSFGPHAGVSAGRQPVTPPPPARDPGPRFELPSSSRPDAPQGTRADRPTSV
ncbi:hypothetical protein JHN63_51005 [Streptomyces sp. MBT65]|uniref:hypothetical protein n=1 Tax=Streptomyces sp. MBT65 TaxID=1488395 RepID=UPI00190E14A8|nr:hypothetical protein [Streptomyces sp. MBT65]MBK3581935.1 hypothetical protein [Streptomyces sp. MBT65]